MANVNTKIEWTDATWSPVTGCIKVSQGCKHCYAERLAPRVFAGQQIGNMIDGTLRPRLFTDVLTHPDRLDAPLRWKKPRRIFVNSMSDLFHENVPDEFVLKVFDIMRQCENGWSNQLGRMVASHTFQILTKRPERMLDFCTHLRFAQNDARGLHLAKSLPDNGYNPMQALRHVQLGVSVEDQATADERIPLLLQTPAAVRFISAEPLLGPVSLSQWTLAEHGRRQIGAERGLHWVIAGGESGPKARPSHPDWFRSLRDQCAAAGVAFFFKQWGEWIGYSQMPSGVLVHEFSPPGLPYSDEETQRCMARIGKKAAGRTLDGRTHDEYPEARS